jgi:hypothetical protein
MCPAFRLDIALSHLLEPVVSDGGRGVQACFKSLGSIRFRSRLADLRNRSLSKL